jgi:hypothetical protein
MTVEGHAVQTFVPRFQGTSEISLACYGSQVNLYWKLPSLAPTWTIPGHFLANFSYCFTLADVDTAPVTRRPNVQMLDEYLPPDKIVFLQNLSETVTRDQLNALFSQHPNLYEARVVQSKKDIAFVKYLDEGSATVTKDALHNYTLDGENKIKVKPLT